MEKAGSVRHYDMFVFAFQRFSLVVYEGFRAQLIYLPTIPPLIQRLFFGN